MITSQWNRVHGRRSIRAGTRLRTGPDSDFSTALMIRPLSHYPIDTRSKNSRGEGGTSAPRDHPYAYRGIRQLPCQADTVLVPAGSRPP